MAIQDDVRKFILEINESKNNGDTLAGLTKLEKETAKLRQENENLEKVMAHLSAKGEKTSDVYKQMEAQLKSNKSAVAANNLEMKGLRKTLDLNYMSMGDLKKRSNELRSTLGSMSKAANPEEYNRLESELKQVGAQMDNLKGKSDETQGSMGKGAAIINKYFAAIAVGAAAVAGFFMKMDQAVQASDNFNDRLANLSSLTGLVGADLEWMGNKAKELSTSTLEGGIIITKSADDIVDAFTKMGSARPELLKNKDVLAQVTEKALILAEASKMELEPAIEAVAAAMNQFNLDASQSDRIINSIAAGSLEGSAEVDDLTESLKNVGTVADGSNMSLEQTIAALEVLGEKQLKGAEAGTKLRGAILKMKDAGVGYASGQFNLRDALEEVNKKLSEQGSELERDALKQKMFGIENITAGSILVQNVEKYDQLTAAVTGTNTAYQQAAKNTNTDIVLKKQAINEYHRAAIELGQNLSPAVTALYRGVASLTRSFSEMIAVPVSEKLRQEQFEVNNLVRSIVSVNDNQKIRNGLIQELQQKYPDFIGNIDAEKVSNEQLLKTLDDVNKSYLQRIKIAVNEEDITKNEKEMQAIWKEQRDLVKDIDLQYSRLVVNKKENATLDEKIAAIAQTSSLVQGYGSATYASNAGIANLQKQRLLSLTEKENDLTGEYNDLLKERETIKPPEAASPGGGDGGNAGGDSGNGNGNGNKNGLSEEQLKEQKEEYDKAQTILDDANNKRMAALIIRYEREGWSDDKFKAEQLSAELSYLTLKKALAAQYGQDVTGIDSQINAKRVEMQKSINDVLAEGDKELFEQIAEDAKILDKAVDESIKIADNAIDKMDQQKDKEKQILEQRQQMYLDFSMSIGESYGQLMSDSEATFADYLSNTLEMALDAFHQFFLIERYKTIMKGIGEGPLGWVAAAGKVAAMEIAFQAAKSLIKKSLGGSKKSGGFTGSSTDDNEVKGVYHANEWFANAKSVRENQPFFAALDAAQRNGTTREFIQSVKGPDSPSYAQSSPATSLKSSEPLKPLGPLSSSSSSSSRDPELTAAINLMSNAVALLMKNGVQFPIVPFKRQLDEVSDLIDQTGMGGFKKNT